MLYEKMKDKKVKCNLCGRRCLISDGGTGFCLVRKNEGGTLYSLVYAKAISACVDPIGKKPLSHFNPGASVMSIATVGCNFRCQFCDNWMISQEKKIAGRDFPPEEVVKATRDNGCQGISYTYTEPTIFFEYAFDTMKIAHRKGIKNVFVSNGYTSKEALRKCKGLLDAINIDLKFWSNELYLKICGAKVKPVLENLKLIKKFGIWLEITTLIIPTLTDKKNELENIAKFIAEELDEETPWHVSAFYPAYKLTNLLSTTKEEIHKAYRIGRSAGLKYVYTGNIPDDKGEDTFCPKCGQLMINRTGYIVERLDNNGKCRKCGEDLNLILK